MATILVKEDWMPAVRLLREGLMAATRRNSSGSKGAGEVIDRITVALILKAAEDLQTLQDTTGLSKTDLVNRAITLYEFIDEQQSAGRDLLIRDSDSGENESSGSL